MPSSWPSPLVGGADPWDGGDADPICSPPHAVALQEVERSRILKHSRQGPVCSKLLLHLMVCEQAGFSQGCCLLGIAQTVSNTGLKGRSQDNPTNITGETFPQQKLNIQVCTQAGGADEAVVEVLRQCRYCLVISISPRWAGSWIWDI